MYYRKALKLQAFLDMAEDEGNQPNIYWKNFLASVDFLKGQ